MKVELRSQADLEVGLFSDRGVSDKPWPGSADSATPLRFSTLQTAEVWHKGANGENKTYPEVVESVLGLARSSNLDGSQPIIRALKDFGNECGSWPVSHNRRTGQAAAGFLASKIQRKLGRNTRLWQVGVVTEKDWKEGEMGGTIKAVTVAAGFDFTSPSRRRVSISRGFDAGEAGRSSGINFLSSIDKFSHPGLVGSFFKRTARLVDTANDRNPVLGAAVTAGALLAATGVLPIRFSVKLIRAFCPITFAWDPDSVTPEGAGMLGGVNSLTDQFMSREIQPHDYVRELRRMSLRSGVVGPWLDLAADRLSGQIGL